MISNPLVSIVIPVYNRELYIGKAIESAINQTYKNIEVIICDNCSTDETWNIVQKYVREDSRVIAYRNEVNLGPVLNWRECFNYAQGEYVKILWSDDWMKEYFIEKALALFDEEVAFVLSYVQGITNDNKIIFSNKYFNTEYTTKEYLDNVLFLKRKEEFPLSPGCALFRLSDVKNALVINIPNGDGLDSRTNGAGNDLLLFLITANKYNKIKILPSYANFFRHHSNSFSVTDSLEVYYEWAKIFFLENVRMEREVLSCFKFRYFILNSLKGKIKYKNLYNYLLYTWKGVLVYIPMFLFRKIVDKLLKGGKHTSVLL